MKPKEECERHFESAYITNTRLMGTMTMYIHWQIEGSPDAADLHQFFYFDVEENGLENYQSIWGGDLADVEAVEHMIVDCLGGERVFVTEKEARMLLREYAAFNKEHGKPLPSGYSEYEPMLREQPAPAGEGEIPFITDTDYEKIIRTDGAQDNECLPGSMHKAQAVLFAKECPVIKSEYELINYFLMRCFARDFFAAAYLSGDEGTAPDEEQTPGGKNGITLDIYPTLPPQTFRKNTIDEKDGFFLCESLVEANAQYRLIVSKIKVENMRIVRYEHASGFKISPDEAMMQLAHSEFITVFDVIPSSGTDLTLEMKLSFNSMAASQYPHGELYIKFNDNNDHVNSRVFMLSDDISGMYYLSDRAQLIAAAYSLSGIMKMERDVAENDPSLLFIPRMKFEFKQPVLYDFINSGIPRFEDFLDLVKGD